MSRLQQFESKLEQLVSGTFAKVFRSAVQPVEITSALQRELDDNTQVLSRNRRLVPNDFHVHLSPADMDRLAPYDSAMVTEISQTLEEYAIEQAYVFPGPVRIHFSPEEGLTTGRFRVDSRAQASVSSNDTDTRVRRARAFLEVSGTRHSLHPPGITVGRGTDTDLRINDPGVSRHHAAFQVQLDTDTHGHESVRVGVRDLGSTNGLFVDGQKLAESPLDDGTEVRVGGTVLTLRLVTETEEAEG